jgi:hypothetical protein
MPAFAVPALDPLAFAMPAFDPPRPGFRPVAAVRAAKQVPPTRRRGQRVAKPKVDMHRTGVGRPPAERRPGGPKTSGTPGGEGGNGIGGLKVKRQTDSGTEQVPLLNRLVSANALQLGRAVGSQSEQRHARSRCLDDGGVKIRGRRA